MILLFQEQTIKYEQVPSTEKVIGIINDFLQDKFYFSHFIVDGKEVMEDPEKYLLKHLLDINSIEIIALTAKEFINDLLMSTEEYIERAVPQIKTLTDEFYNNPSSTSWVELGRLFEGMQWISTMIETVDQSAVRPSKWTEVMVNYVIMQAELRNLEEALENTDTVLIADLLQYEILPIFESLLTETKMIIDTVGKRYDIN